MRVKIDALSKDNDLATKIYPKRYRNHIKNHSAAFPVFDPVSYYNQLSWKDSKSVCAKTGLPLYCSHAIEYGSKIEFFATSYYSFAFARDKCLHEYIMATVQGRKSGWMSNNTEIDEGAIRLDAKRMARVWIQKKAASKNGNMVDVRVRAPVKANIVPGNPRGAEISHNAMEAVLDPPILESVKKAFYTTATPEGVSKLLDHPNNGRLGHPMLLDTETEEGQRKVRDFVIGHVFVHCSLYHSAGYKLVKHPVPSMERKDLRAMLTEMTMPEGSAGFTSTDPVCGDTSGSKADHKFAVSGVLLQYVEILRVFYTYAFDRPPDIKTAFMKWNTARKTSPDLFLLAVVYIILKREVKQHGEDPTKIRMIYHMWALDAVIGKIYKKRNHVATFNAFQYGFTHGFAAKHGGLHHLFEYMLDCGRTDDDYYEFIDLMLSLYGVKTLDPLTGDEIQATHEHAIADKTLLYKIMYGRDDDVKKWDFYVFNIETLLYNMSQMVSYSVNYNAMTKDDFVLMCLFTINDFAANFKIISTGHPEMPFVGIWRLLASGKLDTANEGSFIHFRKDVNLQLRIYREALKFLEYMKSVGGFPASFVRAWELSLKVMHKTFHHSDDELQCAFKFIILVVEIISKEEHYATWEHMSTKCSTPKGSKQVVYSPPAIAKKIAEFFNLPVDGLPISGNYDGIDYLNYNYYDRMRQWRPILSTLDADMNFISQGCCFLKWYFVPKIVCDSNGNDVGVVIMPYRPRQEILTKAYYTTNDVENPNHYLTILLGLMYLTPLDEKCYNSLLAAANTITGGKDVHFDAVLDRGLMSHLLRKVGDVAVVTTGRLPSWLEIHQFYYPTGDSAKKYYQKYRDFNIHKGVSLWATLLKKHTLPSIQFASAPYAKYKNRF